VCGCGLSEADLDGDGKPDCKDLCPDDPRKSAPGVCDCGHPDTDSDGDGTLDCQDGCPTDPNKTQPGFCGCGVIDFDSDTDGVMDCADNCPTFHNPNQQDSVGDGIGDACRNLSDTGRTAPEDQASSGSDADSNTARPVFFNCGLGIVESLAASLAGLFLIQTTARRRRR